MGRTFRTIVGLAPIAALALVFSASAQAHHDERFQFFGTASIAKDPNDSANQVVEIDTTTPGSFGGVFRDVNTKITSLDDHLSVLYYFVAPKSCNQGSPRIQLRIDTDGDGDGDGNAFGHIGPAPAFTACTPNRWIPEDLTISMTENAVQAFGRWDIGQLGGSSFTSWDNVKSHISTVFPNHNVLRGTLVEDPGASPGVTYYDEITIGHRTLWGASDTIGN
jgi:hypothetical protein